MEAGSPSRRKRKLEEPPAATAEGGTHAREPPPGAGEDEEGGPSAVDRISDLPDPILADIISLLPTKGGARTQILASRWRHLWRSASLNLDCDCDGLARLGYHFPNDDHAVAALIPRILSTHPGPGRRFCVPAHYLLSRPAAVDTWLGSPTLDGLCELEFCRVHGYEKARSVPSLPASAFRFSPTLRVVILRKCHLPDSASQAPYFPQLNQLALEDVVVSETSLHIIIAGCPALECLLIHGSSGFRCIRINSLTLRSFGVSVGSQPTDELQLEELIIEDAPCLERLLRLDLFEELNVSITSTPKLQTIGCLSNKRVSSRSFMYGCAAVIEGLHLDRLAAVVCTVKTLAVDLFMNDLDTVIELMKCFPCLEKLYIESVPGWKNLWRRKHRDLIKTFDIRLKTIGLGFYRGIKSEVDFVTFFVLNAKVLELMIVHVSPQDYYQGFAAHQSKKLMFENRASRGARIHFTTDRCLRGASEINHVRDLDLIDPFISRCRH
ncbi:FBD-associated F-box protein At5g60610 [Lolium perenne]|uniref:FBD-associated F-box protein At5g60610 n=1 Tax=Lolium perenne TaxID=4522 RepID=UPI0021F678C5|nr:FBD-associated F-box protein At5g60610-like [Lolium perenne]